MRNPEWIESCQNLVTKGKTTVFLTLRLQFCYIFLFSVTFLSIIWLEDVCLHIRYGTLKDHAQP